MIKIYNNPYKKEAAELGQALGSLPELSPSVHTCVHAYIHTKRYTPSQNVCTHCGTCTSKHMYVYVFSIYIYIYIIYGVACLPQRISMEEEKAEKIDSRAMPLELRPPVLLFRVAWI